MRRRVYPGVRVADRPFPSFNFTKRLRPAFMLS
jgi:hypothetical protein